MKPILCAAVLAGLTAAAALAETDKPKLYLDPIDVNVPPISKDDSVKYDYDIVYVRARRAGDKVAKRFYTDFSQPVTLEPGADLMLLHPDGSEELLVAGGDGSVVDPMVSFDGRWVYYSHIHNLKNASQWSPPRQGADLFKINVKTKKIVRLTNQKFSPNTGAADWSKDFRTPQEGKSVIEPGVYNMGPCPLPGGRIAFTSNRDGFRPARGYPAVALQLFVMDDRDGDVGDDADPPNLEKIGHLNVSGALHPVVLADGRIMYSSLESQGIRGEILWGIWTIRPDGTGWFPLVSAFDPGGAPNGFHFETQLSDGSLVVEEYYNQNNSGFGSYIKLPPAPPDGYPAFGPANMQDPRNQPWRYGRNDNGQPRWYRMPFMPTGSAALTPFTHGQEGPADLSVRGDKDSPKVGKFTHPSGAPDNNLLTVYSPGPVNHQYTFLPQLDGGIYLIKNGGPVEAPAQMRLIKNDPNYNESWPRAVVPYKRIYGVDEPKLLPRLPNDGSASALLPEGTPFGLVGTSSFYKRESYPNGVVPKGSVTATYAGGNDSWKGLDAFTSHGNGMPLNWHNQGADAGLYDNDQIHAVRILAMEPTTARSGAASGRHFHNHAAERFRILGEIPLRKFADGTQPLDPDGNPDTSFLAKIPADTPFTFQTLDKNGMVLNMAQTWHQLRPGEIRNNCGGCHAHSQQPTAFDKTAAARPDYAAWDLTAGVPLLVEKGRDESHKKWDKEDATGLRFVKQGAVNVEYFRDVQPILKRSCTACHTAKGDAKPVGNLNLDADDEQISHESEGKFPGTYYRLAMDERAKFGHKHAGWDGWGYPNASRYVRMFQSRRSLLTWKIFGERLDGFQNEDHPHEPEPGAGALVWKGQKVDLDKNKSLADVPFMGSRMPPPDAVAGTYVGPDGKKVKVEPLTDEDRRTLVRWIDLGCPIDLDYDPQHPEARGHGWMLDDQRPTLTLTYPAAGANAELGRVLVGMYDYYTGLDRDSFRVVADFDMDGAPAGEDLAAKFQAKSPGVWEWKLAKPVTRLAKGVLTASVRDRQGNVSRIERTFSVGPAADDGARINHDGRTLPPPPKITAPLLFNTPEADAVLAAMQVFPKNNPWNEDISKLPIHKDSDRMIAQIGKDRKLAYNLDMGFILVPPDQPKVDLKTTEYPDESDKGPFPLPDGAPIEGWPLEGGPLDALQRKGDGDRHVLVVDPVNQKLHEFYRGFKTDKGWEASCEATFDLSSNALRPKGWTSSDAAGLPIFPAVVRYDEVERGMVEHALRFTVKRTRHEFIYPATHQAGKGNDPAVPAMGQRFRLKADADLSGLPKHALAIAKGLQKYGMFVADNGGDWRISVAPDERIKGLDALRRFKGSDFEVVQTTGENEGPRAK